MTSSPVVAHESVMEAVTEAVLEDRTLRQRLSTAELMLVANLIRRAVARKLAGGEAVAENPVANPVDTCTPHFEERPDDCTTQTTDDGNTGTGTPGAGVSGARGA